MKYEYEYSICINALVFCVKEGIFLRLAYYFRLADV